MPRKEKKFVNYIEKEHFLPSFWQMKDYENYQTSVEGQYVREVPDPANGKEYYLNEPKYILRRKFLLLNFAVPIIYTALTVANIIMCVIKFLYYLITGIANLDKKQLSKIPLEIGKLLLAPLILIFAEAIVIMGLFMPLDARKIFASIERFLVINYDAASFLHDVIYAKDSKKDSNLRDILAPCFQPKVIKENKETREIADPSHPFIPAENVSYTTTP